MESSSLESLVVFLILMVFFFLILFVVVAAILFWQMRKLRADPGAPNDLAAQLAVLDQKLSRIEPLSQTIGLVQAEMSALKERLVSVEQNQSFSKQDVDRFKQDTLSSLSEIRTIASSLSTATNVVRNELTQLAEIRTIAASLSTATNAVQSELSQTRNNLTELQTFLHNQKQIEQQTAASIRRLEMIIAGTQTKGAAGENILKVIFDKLPSEWQVRNATIDGKPVELALKLPNNLLLPIDSKWPATDLMEKYLKEEDVQKKQQLQRDIEKAVLDKAKEVKKYIKPQLTVNFGIVVIPDAIYEISAAVAPDVFRENIVLLSYSLFLPYLLLVFQTILRTSQSIDLQKLDEYLDSIDKGIEKLQEELNGRFSKAMTMMGNSRDEMQGILSKMGNSLYSLKTSQLSAAALPSGEESV
ncbi:MAG: DNA recombination protein RmuC [Chloroflexota bacterium]